MKKKKIKSKSIHNYIKDREKIDPEFENFYIKYEAFKNHMKAASQEQYWTDIECGINNSNYSDEIKKKCINVLNQYKSIYLKEGE